MDHVGTDCLRYTHLCVCGGESQTSYITSFLICGFVTYYLLGRWSGYFLVRNTFFSFLGLIKKCETVCKEQNLIFCHISNVAITGFYVEYVLLSWQIIMGNYLFSKERNLLPLSPETVFKASSVS